MLKRQLLKTKCKVTFRLSGKKLKADSINVLGDFNEWDPKATPMEKLKTGDFKITLDLEKDQQIQFRYIIDQKDWYNDPDADDFVINEFGGHNCVVDTSKK